MSDVYAAARGDGNNEEEASRNAVAQHKEQGYTMDDIANIVVENANGTQIITDKEEIRLFMENYGGGNNGSER